MRVRRCTYTPNRDFVRIRDFLAHTYAAFDAPVNWGIERWNYARYFIAPMLGSYGTEDGTPDGAIRSIKLWEDSVGLWETEAGEIAGATCIEHPDPEHPGFGEMYVQRHPDHLALLDEMIAYGEERYRNPKENRVSIWIYEDDSALQDVVVRRGYNKRAEPVSTHLEYTIGDLPEPRLPDGFRLISMAEENDIERRREIFGRAFNHEDPKEWPSAFAYCELQKAPDYRKKHDLVIVAPDGTYAACCIVWYNQVDRIGHLEPLGTHPDFRRRGLATAIQQEGLRRLKALGATRMPMTGGFDPFYLAFGFRHVRDAHLWTKTF